MLAKPRQENFLPGLFIFISKSGSYNENCAGEKEYFGDNLRAQIGEMRRKTKLNVNK